MSLTCAILVTIFIHLPYIEAKCNAAFVEKIKAMKIKNGDILGELKGKYNFVFLANDGSPDMSSEECGSITFKKIGDSVRADYKRYKEEVQSFDLKENVEIIKQLGKDEKLILTTYVIAKGPEVISFYTCNDKFVDPGEIIIAVSTSASNFEDKVKKVKETLKNELAVVRGVVCKGSGHNTYKAMTLVEVICEILAIKNCKTLLYRKSAS